jgi:hypothetical protein
MYDAYPAPGSEGQIFLVYGVAEFHIKKVDDWRNTVPPLSAVGVMATAELEGLSVPDSDVLLALKPIGATAGGRCGPTILYWRDKFWIPLRATKPDKEQIAKTIWGNDIDVAHFDIIHEIRVTNLKDFDWSI